jgi:hypothetical protein
MFELDGPLLTSAREQLVKSSFIITIITDV